jgi:hypothetical protein
VYLALEVMQHTGRSRHGERWTSFGRNAMPGASPMGESRSFQAPDEGFHGVLSICAGTSSDAGPKTTEVTLTELDVEFSAGPI